MKADLERVVVAVPYMIGTLVTLGEFAIGVKYGFRSLPFAVLLSMLGWLGARVSVHWLLRD